MERYQPKIQAFPRVLEGLQIKMIEARIPRISICDIWKSMYDQVPEFTEMVIDAPVPEGDKPFKTHMKCVNPEAEAIIQMAAKAGCDWAKEKAQELGVSMP